MEEVKTSNQQTKRRPNWKGWWALALLFFAFYAPMIGQVLQSEIVGMEQVCCMPPNRDALLEAAKIARSKRWLSNILVVTPQVIGIIFTFIGALVIYLMIISYFPTWLKILAGFMLAIVSAYLLGLNLHCIDFYLNHTNEFFRVPLSGYMLSDYNPFYWLGGY